MTGMAELHNELRHNTEVCFLGQHQLKGSWHHARRQSCCTHNNCYPCSAQLHCRQCPLKPCCLFAYKNDSKEASILKPRAPNPALRLQGGKLDDITVVVAFAATATV